MIKKIFILHLFLFSASCAESGLVLLTAGAKGSNSQGYRYKCEKVGDCCEVGKDCETKKSTKDSKDK